MKHTKTLLLSIALSIVLLGTAQHSALAFPPSTGTAHEPAAVSFFDLISQFFFGNAAGETSANQYSDAITAEMVDANMPGSLTIHGTIDSTGTALPSDMSSLTVMRVIRTSTIAIKPWARSA